MTKSLLFFSGVKVGGGGSKNEYPWTKLNQICLHYQWALRRLKIQKLNDQNWGRVQKMKI